jgi:2-oxoisovalerate dehydrogenase E1 component
MAQVCVDAARDLGAQGIGCDVIDLRTIAPLDVTPILESVARTSRLLIVHEATSDFGVGAEIAARIADEGVWYLDAPIRRVATPRMPAPYAPTLEAVWLPDKQRIIEEAKNLVTL